MFVWRIQRKLQCRERVCVAFGVSPCISSPCNRVTQHLCGICCAYRAAMYVANLHYSYNNVWSNNAVSNRRVRSTRVRLDDKDRTSRSFDGAQTQVRRTSCGIFAQVWMSRWAVFMKNRSYMNACVWCATDAPIQCKLLYTRVACCFTIKDARNIPYLPSIFGYLSRIICANTEYLCNLCMRNDIDIDWKQCVSHVTQSYTGAPPLVWGIRPVFYSPRWETASEGLSLGG